MPKNSSKAYIVAVDMGYGHQRAAFPLIEHAATPEEWHIDEPMVISANVYPGIPAEDMRSWESTRKVYEFISRMKKIPLLGKYIFATMDYFQRIPSFYPKRNLSTPSLQVRQIYRMIKKGLGKHLIETLNKKPLPLITTFFMPAFFAEEHGYEGEIYCLCTDTDISRAWVPLEPKKSRIIYFAPTKRVKERLELYGVQPEKIVMTGFPMSKKFFGDKTKMQVLLSSLERRLKVLDPKGVYYKKDKKLIDSYFGEGFKNHEAKNPVTITFAVGGAGAQADIGATILTSFKDDVLSGKMRINLVAGISETVLKMYEKLLVDLGLDQHRNKGVSILYAPNKFDYFEAFDQTLIETDILWTKPSELSFYAGLGLPIIIAPTIGSQEESNRKWLDVIKAGIDQENPLYAREWISDFLDAGFFAEAAMNGFLNAPKKGVYHIEDSVFVGKHTEIETIHLI